MTTALRRYEFSERLAEILGESRRDLRSRVTLMISGGIVPPGPRGPGSPPATPDYAADLLIGVMAAPQQAQTAEAIRCYRDLRPTVLADDTATPAIALGAPDAHPPPDDPPELALLPGRPRFGEAVALLLEQARNPETREALARELFGLWVSRGYPVAAVQLAEWWEGRRAVVTQRYELPEGGRPPSWLDPDRGGLANPGLFHSVFLPVGKLIEIASLTAPLDERKSKVPGLGQTTAKLARYRQQWEKFVAAAAAARAATGETGARPSRLAEVTGFGSNPGNLRMLAYAPDKLPDNPALVVVLHGCTQTAAGYDHGAGWSTLADRFGFALLMPEQRRANNPNNCFTWFEPADTRRDSGEPLSIRQMVERMIADHGIDRRRVFVTGLSAGGAMTSVLLATYPDLFAGGAIIAGLPYRAATNLQEAFDSMFQGRSRPAREWGDLVRAASPHKGSWPKVSVWHGSVDPTVKPVNGHEIVKQWADVHGLDPAAAATETVNGFPRRVWRGASGEEVIEFFTIPGMAHGAPVHPGEGDDRCGTAAPFILDVGISSTYHIASFFGLTGGGVRPHSEIVVDVEVDRPQQTAPRKTAEVLPFTKAATEMPGGDAAFGGAAMRAVDPQAIIARALEAAGLLKPSHDTAPETGTPVSGAGWQGEDWQQLADTGPAPQAGPVLFGYASSGIGCVGGNKVKSASRAITLGDRPRLRYVRRLDLRAAVNIFTTASFSVLVDGVRVDEVSVVGMDYAEAAWSEPADIDLARFAGRTVTLTFEVAANSNVCIEVFAKAWIAGITVVDGTMGG